jgi:hypothetical protein
MSLSSNLRGGHPGEEIQWFEDDVGGAIAVRGLQLG